MPVAAALAVLATLASPVHGQDVPSDLEVIATAGGLTPGAPYATVRIDAGGAGSYARYPSADIEAEAEETSSFTVSDTELEQLWQVIEDGGFFDLDPSYADERITGRTFAELVVTANGGTHRVTTRNVAVEAFDDVVAFINELTPGDDDLVYDTSPPTTFTSYDICELPGKAGQGMTTKPAFGKEVAAIKGGSWVDGGAAGARLTANGGANTDAVGPIGGVHSNALAPGKGGTPANNGGAHPGTVVAHRISLQEAVNLGIVRLSSKGGVIFGDGVSIEINNASAPPSNDITLTLYLELWGNAATPANAAAIEAAIEGTWGGRMTSGGKTLHVDVVTRTAPGATSPPGTAGYHQVKLVPEDSEISHVHGEFGVNQGVGGGVWEIGSPITEDLRRTYAHEAGHLFGLPDRYDDFRKQADGNWKRESDGQTFTPDELAAEIAPHKPGLTTAQILNKLNDGRQRVTLPQAGSEEDLMATLSGTPQQSDIDALAAQAGVVVEIRPGDILVNGQGEQNYLITRSEDIFVPIGGSVTLGGLYVACIDLSNSVPDEGTVFDVAPSLSQWSGIEAAGHLQKVADYINEQAYFCPGASFDAQSAIWRISDNYFSVFGYEPIEQFLLEAGVDIGERLLDFPRMTDPNPDDSTTTARTPAALFVPKISSTSNSLLNAPATVPLSGTIEAPPGALQSAAITWALEAPAASGASLTNIEGDETAFTADVRGAYRAVMGVHVTDADDGVFEVESAVSFALVDASTETFESGTLRLGRPFYWETSSEHPWIVSDASAATGGFSAASAEIEDDGATTLHVMFDQINDEPLSFSYRVSSEANFDVLDFAIDDERVGSWSGDTGWGLFSINLEAGTHTATWTYRKDESVSAGADRAWIDDVFFPEGAVFTSIEGPDADDVLPAAFKLAQNYPNPFNPSTTISYALPDPMEVMLQVYDALGRRIATLVDATQAAGAYEVRFDARDLPSGVYHYVLRAGSFEERKSMILLR